MNVEPASGEVNEIDALDELIVPDGAGVIEVSGAPLSTVHVRVAGVASMLPAASVAAHGERVRRRRARSRTSATCRPRRGAVEPALECRGRFVDEKSNVAEPLATVPAGPDLIVVSGATVSTVQVAAAGVGSRLPAASVARTVNVCGPWARLEYDFGDVHEAAAAVSSLQVKLTSGSDAPNEIAALVLGTEPDGADVIVVSGTAVSTVKLAVAGVGSVLPASSLAVTAIVCGPSSSPVYCLGEVHDCAGPPSSEQVNVEPAMLDVNDTDCVEDVTTPLGTGGVSDVWGAVNSPHGPGVGPSIRHTPPRGRSSRMDGRRHRCRTS